MDLDKLRKLTEEGKKNARMRFMPVAKQIANKVEAALEIEAPKQAKIGKNFAYVKIDTRDDLYSVPVNEQTDLLAIVRELLDAKNIRTRSCTRSDYMLGPYYEATIGW